MWVTPYRGGYQELLKALLHRPFGATGRSDPEPSPWLESDPQPSPWFASKSDFVQWAVTLLVSAASLKDTAPAVASKEATEQIVASADAAISQFLDDYCGTPPRLIPWPFPGPPPWVATIASELSIAANSLQEGTLRASLRQLAGQVLERGLVQKASGAGAGGARR